jgi:hypothetical protein
VKLLAMLRGFHDFGGRLFGAGFRCAPGPRGDPILDLLEIPRESVRAERDRFGKSIVFYGARERHAVADDPAFTKISKSYERRLFRGFERGNYFVRHRGHILLDRPYRERKKADAC